MIKNTTLVCTRFLIFVSVSFHGFMCMVDFSINFVCNKNYARLRTCLSVSVVSVILQ